MLRHVLADAGIDFLRAKAVKKAAFGGKVIFLIRQTNLLQ